MSRLSKQTIRRMEHAHYRMQRSCYITERRDADDWSLFFGLPESAWNHAGLLRASADRFEDRLKEIREAFSRAGRPTILAINSLTEPSDAAARLADAGFQVAYRHSWLVVDEESEPDDVAISEPIEVRAIVTSHDLQRGLEVFRRVYFTTEDDDIWPDYERALRASFPRDDTTHYLALLRDRVVGFATSIRADEFSGLYNLTVLPTARRAGVGRALTRKRIADARAEDLQVFLLTERDQVADWHLRNGFKVALTTVGYQSPTTDRA